MPVARIDLEKVPLITQPGEDDFQLVVTGYLALENKVPHQVSLDETVVPFEIIDEETLEVQLAQVTLGDAKFYMGEELIRDAEVQRGGRRRVRTHQDFELIGAIHLEGQAEEILVRLTDKDFEIGEAYFSSDKY